jgi:hypothetical protein
MHQPIIADRVTGEQWTRLDVERMRAWLQEQTGLNLSDMSYKAVVANYRAKGGP